MNKSEAGRLGGAVSSARSSEAKKKRIADYDAAPKLCAACGVPLVPYERRKNTYCSQKCAKWYIDRTQKRKRRNGYLEACTGCGMELRYPQRKYCSSQCQRDHAYRLYIEGWLAGTETGYSATTGSLSRHVRRYLFETRGRWCETCGWCELNPVTGRPPVTIDHIDGRWDNTAPTNLRILCPNHHALTPTFQALNWGNGNPYRRRLYSGALGTSKLASGT